ARAIFRPGQFGKRGHKISEVNEVVAHAARWQRSLPTRDEGDARTSLQELPLVPVDRPSTDLARGLVWIMLRLIADRGSAVVGREEDDRFLRQAPSGVARTHR